MGLLNFTIVKHRYLLNLNKKIFSTTPIVKFHQEKLFLTDEHSKFTFQDINALSLKLSREFSNALGKKDLNGEKIGVYCSNNYTYLISLLAIWRTNGVPLCLSKLFPANYLDYFLADSKCKLVINSVNPSVKNANFASLAQKQKIINLEINELDFFKNIPPHFDENVINLNDFSKKSDALLLYTSGTSGRPKGVVNTFEILVNSIETMVEAWHWKDTDSIISALPLNHFSGLVYCLLTPFYVRAEVDLLAKFNAESVWMKLLDESNSVNLFIGVPTIFNQLIDTYYKNEALRLKFSKEKVREILKRKMRFIGSGSAPLSVKTYNDWYELSEYKILERYGMTEIGMVLSNPHEETEDFKKEAGTVGRPCGKARVRLVDAKSDLVLMESDSKNDVFFKDALSNEMIYGELQVSGPIVFKEYFNKEEQTRECFTEDGWFKTGDTAEFLKEKKVYKIMGRTSVDVIKSGGYKISALDIEKVILSHPSVDDVAVMGLDDPVWGQRVFSLLQLKLEFENNFDQAEFVDWCKQRLPKYSVPTVIQTTQKIPRNQLGKVNKKELLKNYQK